MKRIILEIDLSRSELADLIALEMSYSKTLSRDGLIRTIKMKLFRNNTLLTAFERQKDLGPYMIAANALVDTFFPEEDIDDKRGN